MAYSHPVTETQSPEPHCYHCGQPCVDTVLEKDDKVFCCYGCQTVYEILNENNLCYYYTLDKAPGSRQDGKEQPFSFLDEKEIREKIVEFELPGISRVQFQVPAVHCVSCIWLLENLGRLNPGVLRSEVNFVRKTATVDFNPDVISLGQVAQLMSSVGYSPAISLDVRKQAATKQDNDLIGRVAVAGFCFGNIMLLSFPEYLGLDNSDEQLRHLFAYLNLLLAIPVVFYSARSYFTSAWRSFKQRQINIDVPIALGLTALFLRSAYDISTTSGAGYLDSLAGLVFFLLIGRWFQDKTYANLAFDRDYRSYFPLAIQKWVGQQWKSVVVHTLLPGDRIKIRSWEIIPADCTLTTSDCHIDYSFVTGESRPVPVKQGERIYAGGKLIGQPAEFVVDRASSQSHLTSLWNNDIFTKPQHSRYRILIDRVARLFTWTILGLAVITAAYWYLVDPASVWPIVTSVLIVACPCALALAAPFTYGSMLRVFGRLGLYLKNADVIERMAAIDTIVFDKTGTITYGSAKVKWVGMLTADEKLMVKELCDSSTHPLSTIIAGHIEGQSVYKLTDFSEIPGKGMEGVMASKHLRIGSAEFVGSGKVADASSKVYVAVNHEVRGYFSITTEIRDSVLPLVQDLGTQCSAVLSGDGDGERQKLSTIFKPYTQLLFNQSPHDKLNYIKSLQDAGKHVLMLGDGLNDAGALKQSDVGLAVTDSTGVFTPASDGIIQGKRLGDLKVYLGLAKSALTILKISFVISFLYNFVGLGFAMSGHLTPLIAAILMPISSISVVAFTSVAVGIVSRHKKNLV